MDFAIATVAISAVYTAFCAVMILVLVFDVRKHGASAVAKDAKMVGICFLILGGVFALVLSMEGNAIIGLLLCQLVLDSAALFLVAWTISRGSRPARNPAIKARVPSASR